jgi:SAM-dependent methyltransferase
METITCPISDSNETRPFLKLKDRFDPDGSQEWELQQSKKSGLVYLNPRPDQEEIHKYYESEAYDPFVSTASKPTLIQSIYENLRRWISLRTKARSVLDRAGFYENSRYRVLEIGCATGEFLVELQKVAKPTILRCMGVEPSELAAKFAGERYGLNVLQGELLSVDIPEKMDLVLMWHSLEHIHRINDTLDKIYDILKPGGLLCVAMPNLKSSDAGFYGSDWVAYDAPRHLYHFSPITFEKLLKRHNFSILDMTALPIDSFYNTVLSEGIRARKSGKTPSPLAYLRALWLGFEAAIEGYHPAKASSVLYFIRKSTAY